MDRIKETAVELSGIQNQIGNLSNDVSGLAYHVKSTDTTTTIQTLIDSVADGSVIHFPQGYTLNVGSLNVTGKKLTFIGYGATINCTSSQGAFYKTDHNKKLTVIGLRFIGTGKAINWITTTSGSEYDEFSIQDCRFENADYGIYMDGVREGRVINCSFEGVTNKGIYRVRSVNHDVIGCYWKNTVYGINDDGDGSPYSAGLRVNGGTMIGCQYGIVSQRVDYLVLNDVMIDYCDNPLRIIGVDISVIKGCYITTRTLNPAVYVDQYDVNTKTREFRMIGNAIASNVNDVASDTVVLRNISSGEVSSNSITFWWRYGIDYASCTNLIIEKNKISVDTGSTAPTKYSVYESSSGDASNLVSKNEVSSPISVLFSQLEKNKGYATQNSGEVIAASGVTTVTVAHGLAYTPAKADVKLTPTNVEAAGKNPYVFSVDATNLVIGFTAATTANAGVAWDIKKKVL